MPSSIKQNCTAMNKEKAISILNGMLTVQILGLRFRRNGGQVAEVVVLTSIGDGFEVFGINAKFSTNSNGSQYVAKTEVYEYNFMVVLTSDAKNSEPKIPVLLDGKLLNYVYFNTNQKLENTVKGECDEICN